MKYYIDQIKLKEQTMTVLGWAVGDAPNEPVEIGVNSRTDGAVRINRTDSGRFDVNKELFDGKSNLQLGFCISFAYDPEETYYLVFKAGGKEIHERLDPQMVKKGKGIIRKAFLIIRQYGWKVLWKKIQKKLFYRQENYSIWRLQVQPNTEELEQERKTVFDQELCFSIIVPLYKTPLQFLREMIESVQAQTYADWELCLADGSGDNSLVNTVKSFQEKDARIRYRRLEGNLGIAGNTNAALAMAEGDYIVLLDHDDVLTEDALYQCALRISRERENGKNAEVLYSDEDKLAVRRGRPFYFDPHFKPDYNPDLLRSMNYISHLLVVKKSLADELNGFRAEFDGSQDYDFVFRCVEKAEVICHISRVLYHWRVSSASTAEDPERKRYAFEAGARAIKAHCERIGLGQVEVLQNEVLGAYRVIYPLREKPKVSVIIPNKDHSEDLRVCVHSLMEKASYKNMEVLIVENNSTEKETFFCYRELEEKYPQIKVLVWGQKGFNFSAINNYAASQADGEYLLFLNNDTELINRDCIEELLEYCQRQDVGIAGAQLFYEDDTIQHAGVIVGYKGIAGHAFVGFHKGEKTYFLRSMCAQDLSAVTAACMMTKKDLFASVGGFDETLAVAFNDIDYCLKVRSKGKLVVYNPFAQLHHYESKSRGVEDTPEKVLRFDGEVETFRKRWADILEKGDPYYNPNLTLLQPDFSLRNFEKEPL